VDNNCNPGIEFSIMGSGIKKFVIPGFRIWDHRIAMGSKIYFLTSSCTTYQAVERCAPPVH